MPGQVRCKRQTALVNLGGADQPTSDEHLARGCTHPVNGNGNRGARAIPWPRLAVGATVLAILAGPLAQTFALSRAASGLVWMQTAFDEPHYIRNAIEGPLAFDPRVFGRLPAKLMLAVGITSFDVIAITYDLLLPMGALFAAWLLARQFSERTVERLAWSLALLLAFDLLSFNSQVLFSDPPTRRLEVFLGMPWLFGNDPFPYFNLFRTPEPQTSWVVFLLYLSLVARFATTLDLRSYRVLCLATPLLSVLYVSVAVTAWLLFGALSVATIVLLRARIIPWFAGTLVATAAAVVLLFSGQVATETTAMALFPSHLPILRASVLLGIALLVCVLQSLRASGWQLDGRLLLAGICALTPVVTLNQQLLTGRIIIPQQWELYSNYMVLVVAAGLLSRSASRPDASRERRRAILATAAWGLLVLFLLAGHRHTYQTFLSTNLLSVAQAKAYTAAVDRWGPVSGVVLAHFWDDSLFRIRAADAAPVLGGHGWLTRNRLTTYEPGETWDVHYARNAARIDTGYETLARREITPEGLASALTKEIAEGVCWPTLAYFIADQDCWTRFSNYLVDNSSHLTEAVDPIVAGYGRYLETTRRQHASSRVLLITREPLDPSRSTGAWRYQPAAEAHVSAGSSRESAYAYLQTSADEPAPTPIRSVEGPG